MPTGFSVYATHDSNKDQTSIAVLNKTANDARSRLRQRSSWSTRTAWQQQLFPGQRVIDESDPRTKAALAMAPDGYGWFQADGTAKIKIPIMIMGGGQDTLCPLDDEQEPMYEGIVSTKYLLVLKNADHYAYIDLCSQYSTSDCTTLHAQIAETSTDFWIRYLKNDSTYGANLHSYVASQPDIDLRSNVVE